MFEIEKNIPLLPRKLPHGPAAKYPFALMDVGDSFFVPATPKVSPAKVQTRLSTRKIPGAKFATRQVEGGVRVWRIA